LTKPKYSWTNGQVERMNRANNEATVKRHFYDCRRTVKRTLGPAV
jgi:hypothetical protein